MLLFITIAVLPFITTAVLPFITIAVLPFITIAVLPFITIAVLLFITTYRQFGAIICCTSTNTTLNETHLHCVLTRCAAVGRQRGTTLSGGNFFSVMVDAVVPTKACNPAQKLEAYLVGQTGNAMLRLI